MFLLYLLVAVAVSGVNVPVASLEGVLHRPGDLSGLGLPCA